MSEFENALKEIVTKELSQCARDMERRAALIESLARCLGFSTAMVCNGIPAAVDEMLTGATSYAFEIAVEKSEIARTIAAGRYGH